MHRLTDGLIDGSGSELNVQLATPPGGMRALYTATRTVSLVHLFAGPEGDGLEDGGRRDLDALLGIHAQLAHALLLDVAPTARQIH